MPCVFIIDIGGKPMWAAACGRTSITYGRRENSVENTGQLSYSPMTVSHP
jgi:hypothetical protein